MNSYIVKRNHARRYLLFLFVFHCLIFFISNNINAEVVTDGSVGPATSLSGSDIFIPDTLGTIAGSNLFHSFLKFDIEKNQSVTFIGPKAIANVISRVTGGQASFITGRPG